MLIEFNALLLVAEVLLLFFLPGILLALALFKKSGLDTVEKIFTGCAFGWVGAAIIPFLLFLFLGIPYSTEIAWLSIALFYIFSIALFVKEKAYEGWTLPAFVPTPRMVATAVLVVLILLNFWIRLQTVSPIFYELDPYFYTFGATQLITLGEMPLDDETGWYPEARSSHRAAPLLIYMEAMWYSVYTGGGEYNNYLLSIITSVYPPLAAALAVFFLYLFVRSQYGREAGLMAGGMAGFTSIFLTKTLGGEMEVQPYGFFAIAFFLAMYAWAMKERSRRFAVLAGIAYAAIVLGSSSQIVALVALLIFLPLQGLLLLFTRDNKDVFEFIRLNAIIIFIGPLLSEVLKNLFVWQNPDIPATSLGLIGVLAFVGVLYYLKERISDAETLTYALGGLIVLGGLLVLFTPLGEPVRSIVQGGLGVATYSTALQRTIAEQGVSGAVLEGQLGFLGSIPKNIPAGPFTIPQAIPELIFTPFSIITNVLLGFSISLLNGLFNSNVLYESKNPNMLFIFIVLFLAALLYRLYQTARLKETHLILFFLVALFPASIIGILKAKFTIFTGFLMAAAAGVVVGEAQLLFAEYRKKKSLAPSYQWAPLLVALLLVVAQYNSFILPHALLTNSVLPRFQDDPLATQPRFAYLCEQIQMRGGYDQQICQVAADPVGYASQGTNFQYDSRLCALSIVADPNRLLNPPGITEEESWATSFRCQRINDYWIESMEWIATNTESDARITSWWDYGHWTNLFGQRNTVLRNEHLSLPMIGEVAHGYISGTPAELAAFMRAHDSKYALFDQEILFSGGQQFFGGKYGALNYLACARNNRTSVQQTTGISECEREYLWELIYVPTSPTPEQACTVFEGGPAGTIGYYAVEGQAVPVYCIVDQTLADGTPVKISYYLGHQDADGSLLINRGLLTPYGSGNGLEIYTVFYTHDLLWIQNGTTVGGYDDRKGKFYDSNLYRAFVLEELPGFELVFKSRGDEVKIFKLKE